MPEPDLPSISAALGEATPGPWTNAGYDDSAGDEGWWILAGIGMDEHAVAVTAAKVMNHNDEADAHLIANAPTWLAKLLGALEAVQTDRDEAVAALSGAINGTNDLLDTLLRAEKARAVKITAKAIQKAQSHTKDEWASLRRELDSVAEERDRAEAAHAVTAGLLAEAKERAIAAESSLEAVQRENAALRTSSIYSAQDPDHDNDWRLYWRSDDQLVMPCGRCGVQWWDDWWLPDDEWEAGRGGFDALCRPCFDLLAVQRENARLAKIEAAAKIVSQVLAEEHIEEDGGCFACEVEWPCFAADLAAALAPSTPQGDENG